MGYRERTSNKLADAIAAHSARAAVLDAPDQVIEAASSATARAFAGVEWSLAVDRRVAAYFVAVIRRRVVRSGSARACARLMADTVITELRGTGRSPEAVWTELERGWRGTIPEDVLEEYRARLCA